GGHVRYFETRTKALEYQQVRKGIKRAIRLGIGIAPEDLERHTVKEIIIGHMKTNQLPENVRLVLNNFLAREVSNLSVVRFNKRVAEHYRDTRLNETTKNTGKVVSPRTVKWELSKI